MNRRVSKVLLALICGKLLTGVGNPVFWYSKPSLTKKQLDDLGGCRDEMIY